MGSCSFCIDNKRKFYQTFPLFWTLGNCKRLFFMLDFDTSTAQILQKLVEIYTLTLIFIIKLLLYDAIYRLRFYSLIHILSLSNSYNNVTSMQKKSGDKSHGVIVALLAHIEKKITRGIENPRHQYQIA